MPCRLVTNENGTFLVFDNEEAAYYASTTLPLPAQIVCFGGWLNALQIA